MSGFKYLGVILDPALTFLPHQEFVIERCYKRMGAVRRLAAASWGALSRHIRMLFDALVLSILRYCSGVWMCYLKKTDKCQCVLVQGAKLILGVGQKAHSLGSLRVAGLPTVSQLRDTCCAFAVARIIHRRTEGQEPLRSEVEMERPITKWIAHGRSKLMASGIRLHAVEPRFAGTGKTTRGFWGALSRGSVRIECEPASAQELQEDHSASDWVVYTDGSVRGFLGASAAAIYHGRGQFGPPVVAGWQSQRWSDSFGSEQEGLLRILSEFDRLGLGGRISVFTDSLSNLLSIASPATRDAWEAQIRKTLVDLVQPRGAGVPQTAVRLQFVRGHSGVPGNEIADSVCSAMTEAGEGFLQDHQMEVPFHLVKSRVRAAAKHAGLAELRDKGGFTAEHMHRVNRMAGNPLYQPKGRLLDRSKEADRVFCKMLLGLAPFALYEEGSQGCAACGKSCGRRGAVPHVLFDCPALAGVRERLERRFTEVMEARAARNDAVREGGGDQIGRGAEPVVEWGSVSILAACPDLVMDAIQEVVAAAPEGNF